MTREREGLLLCLVSAAGFGAMAIFAKEAYATGLDVTTLLALRFPIAAAMLWALIALRRRPLGSPRGLLAGGLLGLWYAAQAALFFSALERIDAGLASLLLYVYPALVTLGAFALGRERPDRRRAGALALASAGVVLVLAGGGTGELDALGAALALGAAGAYTVYILASDRMAATTPPVPFAASVVTGAAVAFGVAALVHGELHVSGEGLGWTAVLACVSTVMPIVLFMAGLARVGPSTASIASTVEPPFTVALAWIVFGETLGALQLAGGALVLSAVVLLQLRSPASSVRSVSPESPLARTSLRQSASSPPEASQAQVSATVAASGRGRSPASAARAPDIP
jgi:drug/metabolite transporter (DMT)-like permease